MYFSTSWLSNTKVKIKKKVECEHITRRMTLRSQLERTEELTRTPTG